MYRHVYFVLFLKHYFYDNGISFKVKWLNTCNTYFRLTLLSLFYDLSLFLQEPLIPTSFKSKIKHN